MNPEQKLNVVQQVIAHRKHSGAAVYKIVFREGHILCVPTKLMQRLDIVLISCRECTLESGFTIAEWNMIRQKLTNLTIQLEDYR